ncbi:cadmium resistance transporter [Micromonospora echinofusca]|uniref:cadmium resistance transporter n=1 Tax=Micromonospora echinofusca TaxID=47858 RepID=UPI0033C0D0D7
MIDLLGTAVGAAVVFAATDVDDIVVLTLLFVAARTTGRPRPWQIVAGQYLGIGALALASAVVAAGLLVVPDPWTGLLGLLPVAFGVRALLDRDPDETPAVVGSTIGVAGVTIANGADNIAVYVPVLRALGPADSAVFLLVFVVLIALWCAAGAWLGNHPRVTRLGGRAGHSLVPAIFIAIGVVILATSGVLPHLRDLLR